MQSIYDIPKTYKLIDNHSYGSDDHRRTIVAVGPTAIETRNARGKGKARVIGKSIERYSVCVPTADYYQLVNDRTKLKAENEKLLERVHAQAAALLLVADIVEDYR